MAHSGEKELAFKRYDLPQVPDLPEFTPHPKASKVQELPLVTLGYHNLMTKARGKLASVAQLPGVKEFLDVVHPYQPHDDYKEYTSTNLELRELLTENEDIISPPPKSVLHVGDPSSFTDISKRKVDTIEADIKKVSASMKKSGTADLLFVTGFDDPVTTLTIGNFSSANRLCLRLSDYCLTNTTLGLLVFLQHRYKNVRLYRPLICSPFHGRSTVYVIATDLQRKTVPQVINTLMTKLVAVATKNFVVDTFIDMEVLPVTKESLFRANTDMISRDVKAITELYNFIKDKNFQGNQMKYFTRRKEELSNKWNDHVFG